MFALGFGTVDFSYFASHIMDMEPKDQNVAALEKVLGGLKPGQKSSQIEFSTLRHAFRVVTANAAIDAAKELAERHRCEFRYCREQSFGYFERRA